MVREATEYPLNNDWRARNHSKMTLEWEKQNWRIVQNKLFLVKIENEILVIINSGTMKATYGHQLDIELSNTSYDSSPSYKRVRL